MNKCLFIIISILLVIPTSSYGNDQAGSWFPFEKTATSLPLEEYYRVCLAVIVPNFESLLFMRHCAKVPETKKHNNVGSTSTADQHIDSTSNNTTEADLKKSNVVSNTEKHSGNFDTLPSDILATVIGGIILAIIFFATREKIFPLPNITGQWYLEQRTITSAYNPYKGMILRYVAILIREGNRIEGTGELIYENSSTGTRNYYGKHRRRSTITGYIDKKYFGRDKVQLHVVEDGHGRVSSHFYDLTVIKNKPMEGNFSSMVADSTGVAKCQRDPY